MVEDEVNFDDLDNLLSSGSSTISDKRSEVKPVEPPMDIEINGDLKYALDIMNNTNNHLFLTGKAGTGKSTLIKYFLRNTKKKVVVLAPTGVAAINAGGQTVHSFFKFPPKPLTMNNIPGNVNEYMMHVYSNVQTIIIDEISMVRVDMMDAIDIFLRMHLLDDAPFAGKQIIMVGDLGQLPPVIGSQAEREMITHGHKSEYFFDASVFEKTDFHKVQLTKVYRQTDPIFIKLLDKISNNTITYEELDWLNQKCGKPSRLDPGVINICSTNSIADYINTAMLHDIPNEELKLEGTVEGNFNTKNCPVDEVITVKIGCRVMILTNDPERKYFNGSVGILERVDKDPDGNPVLIIKVGEYLVVLPKYTYESKAYTYDTGSRNITTQSTGTFKQFPIRLAYAVTSHKSQGLTFDRINIDLGNGSFSHGMTYIAISRCRTLEGVTLSRPIRLTDIIYDPRIKKFMDSFVSDNKVSQ